MKRHEELSELTIRRYGMRKLLLSTIMLTVLAGAAWLTSARDTRSGALVSQAIAEVESPSGIQAEPQESTDSASEAAGVAQPGEVQERGIIRPGRSDNPLQAKPIAPTIPGYIGFMTWNGPWVGAVGGGGVTADALRTDVRLLDSWEQFRLMPTGNGTYAIQTANGQYLTAVEGGGRSREPVFYTTQRQIGDSEKFTFWFDELGGYHALRTSGGRYVTALGGGGKAQNAFHTDATKIDRWEKFRLHKCADLGTGLQYFVAPGGGIPMRAFDGGGRTKDAIGAYLVKFDDWARFKLLRQSDGSYALQTSNGVNYLTAVNGGGLVQSSSLPDIFHTDATQVQAWEKFRIVEMKNCAYAIQTVSGFYIGLAGLSSVGSTRVSDINQATKFRLIMAGLTPTGR